MVSVVDEGGGAPAVFRSDDNPTTCRNAVKDPYIWAIIGGIGVMILGGVLTATSDPDEEGMLIAGRVTFVGGLLSAVGTLGAKAWKVHSREGIHPFGRRVR